MISNQETLNLSPYMAIYDFVVPKDNMLRQINELVDFTFILGELEYCKDVISAAIMTTCENSGGKDQQELIEKSQDTRMEINIVIRDADYSEKDNICYAKEKPRPKPKTNLLL